MTQLVATDGPDMALAMLEFVGHESPGPVVAGLAEYADWIRSEALNAGGIGPNELDRLWSRHLCDSLSFLHALSRPLSGEAASGASGEIVDIGAGIGLPGIPLALALPDVEITLLDRSEKRCELARRASRILGLENVEVVQGDAKRFISHHHIAISRATIPTGELLPLVKAMLPDGRLVVSAASRSDRPDGVDGWEIVDIPAHITGSASWLMKASLSVPG